MIDAGCPWSSAWRSSAASRTTAPFKRVLLDVREGRGGGFLPPGRLQEAPKVFDDLLLQPRGGGRGRGISTPSCRRLSVYLEKNVKLKGGREIRHDSTRSSSSPWPSSWSSSSCGRSSRSSPASSRPLGQAPPADADRHRHQQFFGHWAIPIFIGIGALFFAIRSYYATPGGRYTIDKLAAEAPVLGIVLKKIAVARFCAPWPPSSPRASPSSRAWLSRRARRATRSSKKPS